MESDPTYSQLGNGITMEITVVADSVSDSTIKPEQLLTGKPTVNYLFFQLRHEGYICPGRSLCN